MGKRMKEDGEEGKRGRGMGKRMKEDGEEDEGGWGRGRWRMGKRGRAVKEVNACTIDPLSLSLTSTLNRCPQR